MSILVICPNPACGELLDVAQDNSQVLCPICGSVVRQARPSGPVAPAGQRIQAITPAAPAPASPPVQPNQAQQAPPPAAIKATDPLPPPASAAPVSAAPAAPGDDEIIFDIREESPSTPAQSPSTPEPPPSTPARPPSGPVRAAIFNPLPVEKTQQSPKLNFRSQQHSAPSPPPPQLIDPAADASAEAANAPPSPTTATSDFEGGMAPLSAQNIAREELSLRLPRQLDENTGSLSELADKAERIEAARSSKVVALIGVEDAKRPVASLPHSGKIMLVSLTGLGGGLLTGLGISGWHSLLAAYAGAGIGYAAGFVLSFVVVLSVEKHSSLARLRPLTVDGLQAASFAWRKLGLALRPAWLLMTLGLIFLCSDYLLGMYPLPERLQPYVFPCRLGGGILFAWLAVSFWLDFFITAVKAAMTEEPLEALAPPALSLWSLIKVPRDLAAMAFYALPVLTLPLLPLLPLRLAGVRVADSSSPFHLPGTMLIARRRGDDFAILWLLLLLYGSAMAAAISIGIMLCHLLGSLLGMFLNLATQEFIVASLNLAVIALAGSFFCMVGARCVGIFGRSCADQD